LRTVDLKNRVKLSLPNERKLAICDACGCALRLKVWVPLAHINNTMELGDAEKLHADCWVRKERAASRNHHP